MAEIALATFLAVLPLAAYLFGVLFTSVRTSRKFNMPDD
jgi:hypothetical protein